MGLPLAPQEFRASETSNATVRSRHDSYQTVSQAPLAAER